LNFTLGGITNFPFTEMIYCTIIRYVKLNYTKKELTKSQIKKNIFNMVKTIKV